jgi:hypothetical protein
VSESSESFDLKTVCLGKMPEYLPLHAPPGDLDLPLHPHPIVEPGPQPPQVDSIPTQIDTVPKVSAIR